LVVKIIRVTLIMGNPIKLLRSYSRVQVEAMENIGP